MQPWVTSPSFVAEKPNTEAFAPKDGWKTEGVVSPWTLGAASAKVETVDIPSYQTDENLKKQFGIELAKSVNAFEAACKLFGEDTSKALWVSFNWLVDPIVIASRDIYLKTLELSAKPLDRDQLAAKVLILAEGEKVERNGVFIPTIDAKDRIKAYELYSNILGFTGKVEIDNSTNSITHNEMTIKLVKADDKPRIINQAPNVKSEMTNEDLPIKLKLVGGTSG